MVNIRLEPCFTARWICEVCGPLIKSRVADASSGIAKNCALAATPLLDVVFVGKVKALPDRKRPVPRGISCLGI